MNLVDVIKKQPNFPNEDLESANVELMSTYLRHMHEPTSYAKYLHEHFRPVHLTAHFALEQAGVEVTYTPEEYTAFCKGFADFEYVSLMVNPRFIREKLVVKNVRRLLTSTVAIPEIELLDGREPWLKAYPNMNDVLTEEGHRRNESMAALHSRAMGAQLACELQRAA